MALSFVMNVEKMKATDFGRARSHNTRNRKPESQLEKAAWFDERGHYSIDGFDWKNDQVDLAISKAKRKDAIIAYSIILQVGNQDDWRDRPTKDRPCGEPRQDEEAKKNIVNLQNGAKEWAIQEFGAHNIVSMEMHLDESSPHVHMIVTPINKNNELRAKDWIDGPKGVQEIRARAHRTLSNHVECTYTPHSHTIRTGGLKYDPEMAAGRAGRLEEMQKEIELRKGQLEREDYRLRTERQSLHKQRDEINKEIENKNKELKEKAAGLNENLKQRADKLAADFNQRAEELNQRAEELNQREQDLLQKSPKQMRERLNKYAKALAALTRSGNQEILKYLPSEVADIARDARKFITDNDLSSDLNR